MQKHAKTVKSVSIAVIFLSILLLMRALPLGQFQSGLETWIEGRRVFDRSTPEDHLFAIGGEGAGDTGRFATCCEEDVR